VSATPSGIVEADLAELAEMNRSFEHAAVEEIIAWAAARFAGPDASGLVFTCSFEDAVLVDAIARTAPATPIVLLDTQYLFAETHWYVEQLQQRYARLGTPINLQIVRPLDDVVPDSRWQADIEGCCGVRKVEPLNRALAGRAAWITGIRRVDAPTRANAPVVAWDPVRNLVKINPIVTWSDDDLATYQAIHELPANPLVDKGYSSIGCWPCTRPVAPGEDRRAGRWSGNAKVECGLHV
jgi:phosphoadenosine phosphosulfate reductase